MSGGSADYSRYGEGLGSFHIRGLRRLCGGGRGERKSQKRLEGVGAGAPWGRQGAVLNQPCALAPPVLDVSVPALPLLAVQQRFSSSPRGSIFVTGFS